MSQKLGWPVLARVDWRTVTAFGLPFVLYTLTLAPTIYNLDSAELTTAAATGGIVRATGYPLYLLLGYLWSWLPVGDVGYRLNLFSAFNGALTIALAERILRRWEIGGWATFGSLGLLTCATYFWALSLIAEVYTLHTALMAGLILLLLRWADQPTPYRLAVVGLLAGLSLGHHAATVLLIPGGVWYVLTTAPRRALAPRSFLLTLAAGLIGISVYLYLPWRYQTRPAFNYAGHYDAAGVFNPVDLQTLQGMWWLISGRAFAGQMLAYQGNELWGEIAHFGAQVWRAFFAIGLGPGLLGMIILLRRHWRLGGMLLLMFLVNAGFYISYRVVDKDTMFLPAYLIWALWLGVGYQWLLKWMSEMDMTLEQRDRPVILKLGLRSFQGILAGSVLLVLIWNWRLVDLSEDWSARARGEAILHQAEPHALILGWWDTAPVVEYLQLVEEQRPDVRVINRFLIGDKELQQLIKREIQRRPVYIDDPPANLLKVLKVGQSDPLYRLEPRK